MRHIIYIAMMAVAFCACVEDKGSYENIPINEVEITGIEEEYTALSKIDVINISTQISGSIRGNDDSDYEYLWTVTSASALDKLRERISTEKDLSYKVDLTPGSYYLYFEVYDKKTELKWQMRTSLNVTGSTTTGFLLLGDKEDGTVGLDMIAMPAGRDTTVAENVFENTEGLIGAENLIFAGSRYAHQTLWMDTESGSYALTNGSYFKILEDINPDNMFEFWDFVGGRYSMWSAIGLSIAIAIGMDNFEKMLDGAYAMDRHFRETDFAHNIPVIMALLGIWYNNFFNLKSYAVVPYDEYLKYLPSYLQQLDMESNGKFVSTSNEYLKYATGPVLFGGAGTNVQHSFFQLIHQGTTIIPCDFIIPAISHNEIGEHHEILVANVLAQSEALMRGKTIKEAAEELTQAGKSKEEVDFLKKFKSFEGNRPSNTFVVKKIDPYTLGMLVAMYEHKVFVQGVIWNIDSFDQMGVELGKQLAKNILPELQGNSFGDLHDSSTENLIRYVKRLRK